MGIIYMDHAATTKTDIRVVEVMKNYCLREYGNPSSSYGFSNSAKNAVRTSRKIIADSIGAKSEEIYFTSGGSESDNLAIKGYALNNIDKGNHIITSSIEHHAVLKSCEFLEKYGFKVTYLPVDEYGYVNPLELEAAITNKTILVSIMYANNEIGTIEPIYRLSQIVHKHNIVFHTDAVQAYGHEKINVNELGIDMLSASGHKFYGPKGTGFLYVRKGIRLEPLIHGGHQEHDMRAGTENVPGIVGIGKASELAMIHMKDNKKIESNLRNYFIRRVLTEIPYTRLNGTIRNRLDNNINISFQFVQGEALLVMLDMHGIACSTGSACNSSESSPSHVLKAIGLSDEMAGSSIRFTIGKDNTKEEIDRCIALLKQDVSKLRLSSPLYNDYISNML